MRIVLALLVSGCTSLTVTMRHELKAPITCKLVQTGQGGPYGARLECRHPDGTMPNHSPEWVAWGVPPL